jgi:energy-coupling factor transport system permease protein
VSLVVPLVAGGGAPLARRNPLAKVLAAALIAMVLLVSLDPVTPGLLLAAELAAVPFFGIRPATLLRRSAPLLLGCLGVGVANLVATQSPETSATVVLRVAAVALPGILALATTDPVDLADALVQHARLPARFAYGALAALRLLPLLSDDWHAAARARRARGVDAGRNPVAALRIFGGQVFSLLVTALRRSVRLAAAMDARGFGTAGVDRTYARDSRWGAGDTLLVVGAVAVAAAATAVSVWAGRWAFLLS